MTQDKQTVLKILEAKSRENAPFFLGNADRSHADTLLVPDVTTLLHTSRFASDRSLSGLMPFGDANALVMEMARESLISPAGPVLAGVCGTDPFRLMGKYLEQVKETGFAGVINFPSIGLIDGQFRKHLEDSQIGYQKEVEMIRLAHDLGLFAAAIVFNEEEAQQMITNGADLLVLHLGMVTKSPFGAGVPKTLPAALEKIEAWIRKLRFGETRLPVLVHGGPVRCFEDGIEICRMTRCVQGFYLI